MAGSKSPMEALAPPPCPTMVVKVGRTRWEIPTEFSVVRSSSNPVGSSAPAPTPSAYSSASLWSHDRSEGSEVAPTASRFSPIARTSLSSVSI